MTDLTPEQLKVVDAYMETEYCKRLIGKFLTRLFHTPSSVPLTAESAAYLSELETSYPLELKRYIDHQAEKLDFHSALQRQFFSGLFKCVSEEDLEAAAPLQPKCKVVNILISEGERK